MSGITRHGLRPFGPPIATAVEADGWLHVCGQVPRDPENNNELATGSITVQAEVTFKNLIRVLESAGYSLADVVKINIWLDDARDFADFNKVYTRYFAPEHAPARVCVVSSMVVDCKVEMDCIAYKKPSGK
ncbi:RidA family protein [Desulfovibrio sp. OttesenSCG-928-G15]|nr:RidA family protein [Desulfovibrio sp. OttesenSCG-928-G15]